MMSEETAQRIATALERIADRLERGHGAGGVPAYLMPGERVFVSGAGFFVPGAGPDSVSVPTLGCGGGA